MTTHSLRRWGASLITGGLCLTVAYSIFPSTARSALIRPVASLGLVGILLVLPALVAFQRGQSASAGVNGWIGAAMLCLSLAFLEIPHLVLGAFSPRSLYDLDAYHASFWGTAEFVAVIGLAPALIVLAVSVLRSRTYPRWAAWALVANVVVSGACAFVQPLGDALHTPAPSYLLTALIGVPMIRMVQRERITASPSAPAPRHAAASTPAPV
jgi:uncharacterized membrane protein YgdD (TMEM256/DUF423 family)